MYTRKADGAEKTNMYVFRKTIGKCHVFGQEICGQNTLKQWIQHFVEARIDWLIDWLVGWMVCRSVNRLIDRFDWLIVLIESFSFTISMNFGILFSISFGHNCPWQCHPWRTVHFLFPGLFLYVYVKSPDPNKTTRSFATSAPNSLN